MENNNIRTMEYIGMDYWSRPVYKCIENNKLWKDLSPLNDGSELYTCQNDFDGEPDCPIKKDLEIRFKTKYKEDPYKRDYMMLGRLQSDCKYYLGYGNRYAKHLWAGDEQKQIDEMKKIYNSLPKDAKPEWLTYKEILAYEKEMIII